jgi:hypothetical protein
MTTPDLLPAQCPNCGGKLNVDPSLDSLTCQFCNTEHMIRRNVSGTISLEAFARCPLCKRNDQVEKISAILNKQTSQSNGYVPQQRIFTDNNGHVQSRTINVQVQTKHETTLAQRLVSPEKPKAPGKMQTWPILLLAVPAIFYAQSTRGFLTMLVALLFTAGLFAIWIVLEKDNKKKHIENMMAHERELGRWKQAVSRWQSLYYCGRDDIVFVPGEKTSANMVDFIQYVYTLPRLNSED